MSDSISRQAAIDALREAENHAFNGLYKGLVKAHKIVADLPSVQPEPQWIPCSEELPKEEENTYWICTDIGYQYECRWTNVSHIWTDMTTNWHWHIADYPQCTKVIAWMPLPPSYEGVR